MCLHTVRRADGEILNIPVADQGFPGAWFGEALLRADALHDLH